jgi:hypothetical protein
MPDCVCALGRRSGWPGPTTGGWPRREASERGLALRAEFGAESRRERALGASRIYRPESGRRMPARSGSDRGGQERKVRWGERQSQSVSRSLARTTPSPAWASLPGSGNGHLDQRPVALGLVRQRRRRRRRRLVRQGDESGRAARSVVGQARAETRGVRGARPSVRPEAGSSSARLAGVRDKLLEHFSIDAPWSDASCLPRFARLVAGEIESSSSSSSSFRRRAFA